jgi:hypothetical protein
VAAAQPLFDVLYRHLAEAGRDRANFGLEMRIGYGAGKPDVWAAQAAEWQALGATHLTFNTMGAGLTTPAQHLAAIRAFAEAVGLG